MKAYTLVLGALVSIVGASPLQERQMGGGAGAGAAVSYCLFCIMAADATLCRADLDVANTKPTRLAVMDRSGRL
jgi:hypothetical protein